MIEYVLSKYPGRLSSRLNFKIVYLLTRHHYTAEEETCIHVRLLFTSTEQKVN